MNMQELTPTCAAIEEMRNEPTTTGKRRTAEQIRAMVDGLKHCWSLTYTAEMCGLSESEVLDDVADFGTWLSHVRGKASLTTVESAELDQLFPSNNHEGIAVVPPGFEPSAPHKRSVLPSLAVIVETDPDDQLIARYIARKYPSSTVVLTYPIVTTVAKTDELGRLDEIGEVSKSPGFRRTVVQAFDMLATAIGDANRAVRELVRLTNSDEETILANLDVIEAAATKLSWLQPREADQLTRLVEFTRTSGSDATALIGRLRTLRRVMQADPASWRVTRIGELNQGQLQSIAQAAGLNVEGVSRNEESEIRARLSSLGLKSDADRLVPEGVRATLAGVADEFWEAMQARAEGDPSWDSMLARAYSDA